MSFAERLFKMMDVNKDGVLTMEEFIKGFQKSEIMKSDEFDKINNFILEEETTTKIQNESSEIVVEEEMEKNIYDETEQILDDNSDEFVGDIEAISENSKNVVFPDSTTHTTEKGEISQPESITTSTSTNSIKDDSKKEKNDNIEKTDVILEETMTVEDESSEIVVEEEMEKNIHDENVQILDNNSEEISAIAEEDTIIKIPKTVILPNITTHTENTQTNIIVNLETFDDIVPHDSTNVQAIQVSYFFKQH